MTFSVVIQENEKQRIVGTIFAQHEAEASTVANDLYPSQTNNRLSVKRVEDREVSVRIPLN